MNIVSVDSFVAQKLSSVPKNVRWAAGTAFILGFIIHISAITGMLCNWDSVISIIDDSKFLVGQGKWFFPVVQSLKGYVGAGALSGPLALVMLAVTSGLTVSLLEIKKPLYAALTGGLTVSFLSVMCTFSYSGEDVFFFSLMLSALAVFLTVRYRLGFIPGLVLLTLSLGTYQAFVGYAAGLSVLYCLTRLVYSEESERNVIRKGAKLAAILLVSVGLYYIILKLLLRYTDTELSYYREIDTIGDKLTFGEISNLVKSAPVRTIQFFVLDRYGDWQSGMAALYTPVLIIICLFGVYTIIKSRSYNRPLRLGLEALLLALLPLAVNVIAVLSRNLSTHWIMIYPFALIFILPLKLADAGGDIPVVANRKAPEGATASAAGDRYGKAVETGASVLQWAAAVLSAVLIFTWGVYTNHGYQRLTLAYEGAYAECVDISSRIEQLHAQYPDKVGEYSPRVLIVAERQKDMTTKDLFPYLDPYTGIANKDFLRTPYHYEYMLTNYLGKDYSFADDAARYSFMASPQFEEMSVYPAAGCVTVSDDGWIVVRIQ